VEGKAKREAGFPGESLVFEVSSGPDGTEDDISWSGGGSPAAWTGRRFVTSFDSGGTYTVTARCGTASHGLQVAIRPRMPLDVAWSLWSTRHDTGATAAETRFAGRLLQPI
jgi:hypothetical protein